MHYKNNAGELIPITSHYAVDITEELVQAGQRALPTFHKGWYHKNTRYPAGIFYLLGAGAVQYVSNQPSAVHFTYYFEVRSKSEGEKDRLANKLCEQLGLLYKARRTQFDDSFDNTDGARVKRITFSFHVPLIP